MAAFYSNTYYDGSRIDGTASTWTYTPRRDGVVSITYSSYDNKTEPIEEDLPAAISCQDFFWNYVYGILGFEIDRQYRQFSILANPIKARAPPAISFVFSS